MGALDGFKLQYERMGSEGKLNHKGVIIFLRRGPIRVFLSRVFRAIKYELGRDIAPVRLFKRLQHVEAKLDKPLLYDSELSRRIEQLEAKVEKVNKGKRYGKPTN